MKTTLATLLTLALFATTANATPIYSESFDYGDSDFGFNTGGAGSWSSGSGVLKYDADGGLDVTAMANETGGAMWMDFNDVRSATDSSLSHSNSAGGEIWMATLFQYVSGTTHVVKAEGGSVTGLGFVISSAGDVQLYTAAPSNTNGAVGNVDTNIDAVSGTYLMLTHAIIGTNSFNNSGSPDSTIEFWFDPADASSIGNLGTADLTINGSKFGRTGQDLSSLFAQPSAQGRIDEIRLGTELADVIGVIPEPASLALFGIGGLLMIRRRKV